MLKQRVEIFLCLPLFKPFQLKIKIKWFFFCTSVQMDISGHYVKQNDYNLHRQFQTLFRHLWFQFNYCSIFKVLLQLFFPHKNNVSNFCLSSLLSFLQIFDKNQLHSHIFYCASKFLNAEYFYYCQC